MTSANEKLADENVQRQHETKLSNLLLQSVGDGILGVDERGLTTFANPAACRLLGYKAEELIGKPLHDSAHHSYPDGSQYPTESCPMYMTFSDGEVHHVEDEVLWRKDGKPLPVAYTSTPLWENDKLSGAVISFADISEKKSREEELIRRSKTLALLRASAEIANTSQDLDTAIEGFLREVCEYTGWEIGHAYFPSLSGEHLLPSGLWYFVAAAGLIPFVKSTENTKFCCGEGLPGRVWASKSVAWISDVISDPNFPRAEAARESGLKGACAIPVLQQAEVVAVMEFFSFNAVHPDQEVQLLLENMGKQLGQIFERAKTKSQLVQAKAEAEEASKTKSEFLASMSHELRTPLNAVLGFSQMLQFDPKTPLLPSQNEYVENIISGGNHLLELVNEILDLAKIEAGQFEITLEDIDANEVVAKCVALTTPLGRKRGISIVEKFGGDRPASLRSDQTRLKQVVLNLISNAVKFNRDGGTVIIESRETENGFLRISVTDTGIGIAKEDYANVFQMFHRLGTDSMVAQEGTGIGLTVTKILVERLGGYIGFESEIGKGSTFWIELPFAPLIWEESLSVGVEAIDADHKKLISLLDKLTEHSLAKGDVDAVLNELIDYTLHHFRREEAIMEACGYPDLDEHRSIHGQLAKKVGQLAEEWYEDANAKVMEELVQFLREWLVKHIMHDDAAIGPFTKGKEIELERALEKIGL